MDFGSGAPVDSRNADTCRRVLGSLPLTNVATAHHAMHELLAAMHQAPPPAREYLSVLELAREPLAFLQEAMSNRYASRPLPASDDETAAFQRTVALWQLVASSYARVAQLGGDPEIQNQLAVVCQRCLYYAGQTVLEHYRARRVVAPGCWMDFHGYFDTADDWDLTRQPVIDSLGLDTNTTSCAETYAWVLLVDLANPYSRTPRELSWILRWAKLLAPATAVNLPDEEAGGRGYGVDLMQDRGVQPVENMRATASARLFDTSKLVEKVQTLVNHLRQGRTPESLGLGDCPRLQASRLLVQLYRPWCLAAMPRRFQRNRAQGSVAMVYGLEAIYYQITGQEFSQPSHVRTYSRADMDAIWTFRNQLDPMQPLSLRASQLGYTPDPWSLADESLTGFRAYRAGTGPRVEHGQLVAVRPPGKDHFLAGRVSWLMQEADGRLQAGFQVLPGPAEGVALRPTGISGAAERYSIGLLLPAVPSLKEPVTLVVPGGWFSPDRIIEIHSERPATVRLQESLSRGPNFERCTFVVA